MKFISHLKDAFYFTVEGIRATDSFFTSGLRLSYFIGQCIVAACVHIAEEVYIALQLIYSAMCILYEDYCFFVVDLISKVKCLCSGINFAINYVYTCFQHVVANLKHLFESVLYFCQSNVEILVTIIGKAGSSLYYLLEVMKQTLIFMGSSIWYFISIIPVSIVYMATLFLCYINQTVVEFYRALESVCNAIFTSIQKLILFFSDIPGEAAFGLILGLTAICFLARHYNILIQLMADLALSVIRSCHVFNNVWMHLKNIFIPLFSNSRNRRLEEEEEEEEEEIWNFPQNRRPSRSVCSSSCDHEFSTKLCIVCQDKEKTVIVLPCRHVCLCSVCCTIIEEQYGRCPVCRQRVERTMTVYI